MVNHAGAGKTETVLDTLRAVNAHYPGLNYYTKSTTASGFGEEYEGEAVTVLEDFKPPLLEMWCDDHTVNWCEWSATGVTPLLGVMFSPVK